MTAVRSLICWFVLLGPISGAQARALADGATDFRAPAISVAQGDWGNVSRAEIQDVLVATARELQVLFPERHGGAIRVEHSKFVPMVLYQRNADGEYVIHLTVTGRRWAEYTYEFAHELCHVYADYQQHRNSALAPHQWFEESLCETASLFVLRRMSRAWQAPAFEQRNYAPIFSEYATLMMDEPHRHGALALGQWYAHNATRLSHNPYGRDDNEYCANRLLTLFEAQPEGWKSLPYLNAPTTADELSFSGYLQHWHDAVPSDQRHFVDQLLLLFGLAPAIRIDAATSQAAASQ